MNDSKQADKYVSDGVIAVIQEIARVLWSVAALLAPWLVPLAPAVFFGWVIYQTAIDADMPEQAATWAAVAAAVGLETVNIAANHAMLKLSHDYKEHPGKFGLSILFITVYVTIGVVAMLMLNVSDGVRIIGVGMFLLAPVAIGAQALTMDLVRVRDEGRKREEVEADDRQWNRDQEQRQQELDHERKLELAKLRWQHKTEVAIAAGKSPETDGKVPVTSATLPRWLPRVPADLAEFRQLVTDGVISLEGITGEDLMQHIPAVHSDRTGRYWLEKTRNNGKEPAPERVEER